MCDPVAYRCRAALFLNKVSGSYPIVRFGANILACTQAHAGSVAGRVDGVLNQLLQPVEGQYFSPGQQVDKRSIETDLRGV